MNQKMAPRGARWNLPDWQSDPDEWDSLNRRVSELEAEKQSLSQEIATLEADLARAHRFWLQGLNDAQRAKQADALEKQRDQAIHAATSFHAIAHHLGDTLQSGFVFSLATILLGSAEVAGARFAYRVSWRGPRSSYDPAVTRRGARKIHVIAAQVARAHQQRGGRGFITLAVSAGDARGHDNRIADAARAHALAAMAANGVSFDRVRVNYAPYRQARPYITISLHDTADGTSPLLSSEKSERFSSAAGAEPITHILPALAEKPAPAPVKHRYEVITFPSGQEHVPFRFRR